MGIADWIVLKINVPIETFPINVNNDFDTFPAKVKH